MTRSRAFCWTLNNPSESDVEHLSRVFEDGHGVSYLCWGVESAPTTGTVHLQGYCYFENAKSLKSALRVLGCGRAHMEVARGSPEQNRTYCSKEGAFTEFGALPQQGQRRDLVGVRNQLADGAGLGAVVASGVGLQGIQYAQRVLPYIESCRRWKPTVKWYWGPAGYGKTRRAFMESGDDVYIKTGGVKWFDGYDAHSKVIFDDIRNTDFGYSFLLQLLDRYPCRVECKGGSRQFLAKEIWITCPISPRQFTPQGEEAKQLERRIDEVIEFEDEWLPPVELPQEEAEVEMEQGMADTQIWLDRWLNSQESVERM